MYKYNKPPQTVLPPKTPPPTPPPGNEKIIKIIVVYKDK